ncbi:ester cyclase [Mycobacterium sp. Soil538]|nr:ester cyclase [Mycobacterium sp. Soil538]
MNNELLPVYRDYLVCLNERRWDDLGRFVAEDVVYNRKPIGLSGYRAMLEADVAVTPDLQFVPEIVLADDRVLSCRLFFQCTPQEALLGIEPTGRRVSFPEHVFYAFANRQIVEVWSVIDKEMIREQLSEDL